MAGATVGAAFGPWGAAAGGVVGGALGYFGGGGGGMDRSALAEQRYGGVNKNNYGVPGYGGMFNNYGNAADRFGAQGSRWQNEQNQFGNVLRNEAMGRGVGQRLVTQQAHEAADRASAQQFAAVGGARPGMQAMAARNAMLGTAMAQSQVGGQAANASGQMTLGAQGQYGNFMQGARAGDMQQQMQNNNAQLQAWQQQQQLAGMQQAGNMGYESQRGQRYAAMLGQNQPTDTEKYLGLLQGGLSAYGATRSGQGGGGGSGYVPGSQSQAPLRWSGTGTGNGTQWDPNNANDWTWQTPGSGA